MITAQELRDAKLALDADYTRTITWDEWIRGCPNSPIVAVLVDRARCQFESVTASLHKGSSDAERS